MKRSEKSRKNYKLPWKPTHRLVVFQLVLINDINRAHLSPTQKFLWFCCQKYHNIIIISLQWIIICSMVSNREQVWISGIGGLGSCESTSLHVRAPSHCGGNDRISSFWCCREMGSVPNCDSNGNGKMDLMPTNEDVHIAATMVSKNVCKKVTLPSQCERAFRLAVDGYQHNFNYYM